MDKREQAANEYWHSFKGTSLEHDEQFKSAIYSAFIHGYQKSNRNNEKVKTEPLPNQTTKTVVEIKSDIDKAMIQCWTIIKETQDLYLELNDILKELYG
jgi:hypothetical protein